MTDFLTGFLVPKKAYDFLKVNPGLRKYFLWPVVLNSFVLVLIYFLAGYFLVDWLGGLVIQSGAWWQLILYYLAIVVLSLALLLIFTFTFSAACNIIGAPFYEKLSEQTEKLFTQNNYVEEKFSFQNIWRSAKRTVFEEIKKFLFFDLSQLVLLILNLIPFLGTFLYGLINLYVTWWLLAYQYLEIPLGRAGLSFASKRKFVNKHKAKNLGFGLAVFLGTLIPGVNIFYIPLCVVAGTIMASHK